MSGDGVSPMEDKARPGTEVDIPNILDGLQGNSHQRTKLRLHTILGTLYLVLTIVALDQTIVATAIPTITSSLKSSSGYTWIGTSYLLAKAATGPLWAKCSDIWGRKPLLLLAVGIFFIASMMCALATSMAMLISGRALQGVAGSALFQLTYIIIADLFPVRERPLYIAFMGVIWIMACGAGPVVGGVLAQRVSWRWCFWINLPICATTFALLLVFLDVHNPRTGLKDGLLAIDWLGTTLSTGSILLLLLGLTFGGATFPWRSPEVICLIVIGMLVFASFIYCEKKLAKYPLIPLSIFKDRSNCAAVMISFSQSMVQIGQDYYLPFYFQSVKLLTPSQSGAMIIPILVAEGVVDILCGIIIHKTGRYRELTWVGVVMMTLGMGLFIVFDVDTSVATLVGLQIIGGIGTALLFQTPTIAVQNSVTQANTASAIAALACTGNFGTAVSVVIGGAIFQNSITKCQSTFASLNDTVVAAFTPDRAAASVDLIAELPNARIVQDAFAWSIRNIFITYTVIAGLAVVASIGLKQQHMSSEHVETKTGIETLTRLVKADDSTSGEVLKV